MDHLSWKTPVSIDFGGGHSHFRKPPTFQEFCKFCILQSWNLGTSRLWPTAAPKIPPDHIHSASGENYGERGWWGMHQVGVQIESTFPFFKSKFLWSFVLVQNQTQNSWIYPYGLTLPCWKDSFLPQLRQPVPDSLPWREGWYICSKVIHYKGGGDHWSGWSILCKAQRDHLAFPWRSARSLSASLFSGFNTLYHMIIYNVYIYIYTYICTVYIYIYIICIYIYIYIH